MTDPTSAKTTPVRLSAKKAPVAEGVIETAPETALGAVRSSAGTVGATGAASGATATSDAGGSGQPGKARTAPRPAAKPSAATGPRRVRLSVSRVDPWSIMKLGFLLSVALGIMTVVAAAVAWNVVDSMGVFTDLESLLSDLGAIEQFRVIMEYLRLKNIMSMAVVVSIVNVALITALATLGAFLYNITAALVGGLHLTLTDD